jgi:hypothetical protein
MFLSHTSVDDWVAKQMKVRLEASGAQVFLDNDDIHYGDDFSADILTAIERSEEMVVLLSPWAFFRPWIWIEIARFTALKPTGRLIGVLYGEEFFENIRPKPLMPEVIAKTNYVKINQFDQYVTQLRSRIEARHR